MNTFFSVDTALGSHTGDRISYWPSLAFPVPMTKRGWTDVDFPCPSQHYTTLESAHYSLFKKTTIVLDSASKAICLMREVHVWPVE